MHLDLTRDSARDFPSIGSPREVRSARIWHCKYRTLKPLAALLNLEVLVIASLPDDSLSFLEPLTKLRDLRILHLPKVHELGPIAALRELRSLSLATTPGWDSSGRIQRVDSLEPIAALPHLQHLELFSVATEQCSLDALAKRALVSARFQGYPKKAVVAFHEATLASDSHLPEPDFQLRK